MAPINLSERVAGSGNTDQFTASGGLYPGLLSTDAILSRGPNTFTVTAMGATLYSSVAQSLVANAASAAEVRDCLANLIKELVREGVIKGTFAV